jgi:hypothetical protein
VHAVFSMHDPAEMRDLLAAARFDVQDVHSHRRQLQLPPPRDFMWQYIYSTPLLAVLPQSGNAQTVALEQAVVAGWQPWVTRDGMSCQQSVLVASARRSA